MTTPLARELFPITERYRYLDHAGVAPISRVVADATQWWAEHMLEHGKVDYDALEARQASARETAARLMGVAADDVALLKNTTEGLAFVAGGLDWTPGDRVLVPDLEFPSTIYPWLPLRERGVIVDLIAPDPATGALPLEAFERAIATGPAPKVVATSWVQYSRGWRTDLAALARVTHDAGALLCVDIIQGLGVLPAALAQWGVDFAMGGAHKWLLGPEGQGVFYVAPHVRDRLRPLEPGWASVVDRWNYEKLDLEWDPSARRYEGGSPNMVGLAGLDAALQLIEKAGVDAIWRHVDALCDHFVNGLALGGVRARILSDRSADGRSGIVTFSVEGIESDDLARRLRERGFVCSPRRGGVRVAPHGYNTVDEIDELLAATADEQDRQSERHGPA